MKRAIEAITAMRDINAAAREARRTCTDIIRQTSNKPYYGKRGAAAMCAAESQSTEQLHAIAEAVAHLRAANTLLVDIAVNGGTTQAQIIEMLRSYDGGSKGQVIEVDDTNK